MLRSVLTMCLFLEKVSTERRPSMSRSKITKIVVDQAGARALDYFIWDSEMNGFGLKVSKGGRKTYVCQYRTAGGRSGGRGA